MPPMSRATYSRTVGMGQPQLDASIRHMVGERTYAEAEAEGLVQLVQQLFPAGVAMFSDWTSGHNPVIDGLRPFYVLPLLVFADSTRRLPTQLESPQSPAHRAF